MDFEGPSPADFENVRSLNAAFLELLQTRRTGGCYTKGLPRDLGLRLQRLARREIEWLAATPFLLLSFRERDDRFWRRLLRDDKRRDLFSTPGRPPDDVARLISAGLGFIWQLANRNPYAARILCGATTHWCEQITERTFIHILTVAGRRPDLPVLRARDDGLVWQKLLGDGLSRMQDNRHAAHISALQYVLTQQASATAWSAAACAARDPALKVADK